MEEHFVYCQSIWWHFWIKPLYGLCFRKKEQGRFYGFEVLLPDACEDFYVLVKEDCIHLVCQDRSGNILYLFYGETGWQKATLLESKSAVPYPKHFSLVPMGNFLNLFYVIAYQERHMLVHQILTDENRPPSVIDYIRPATPAYLCCTRGSDITVLYENEASISGSRVFRWSKKVFSQFMPTHPQCTGLVRDVLSEPGNMTRYAAIERREGFLNLIYFEKNGDTDFTEPVTVALDLPPDACPVFCRENEKLYLIWQEGGTVMSSHSIDEGKKWSKPIRYMKGSGTAPIRYIIHDGSTYRKNYGYEKDGNPVFYVGKSLADPAPASSAPAVLPEGYEAESFAKEMGATLPETPSEKDPLLDLLQQELTRTKGQVLSLKKELSELSRRIEKLEDPSPNVSHDFVDTDPIL